MEARESRHWHFNLRNLLQQKHKFEQLGPFSYFLMTGVRTLYGFLPSGAAEMPAPTSTGRFQQDCATENPVFSGLIPKAS